MCIPQSLCEVLYPLILLPAIHYNTDGKLQTIDSIKMYLNLRLDIVVWSTHTETALLVELSIPREAGRAATSERMRLRYTHLAAECREAGRTTIIVELWCRSLPHGGHRGVKGPKRPG